MLFKNKKMFLGAAAFVLALAFGVKVHAQTQSGGLFNACVSANFNGSYGWLQFVNNCNQPLHFTWFWRDQDYNGSSSDNVRVGGATNTGMSRSEVQQHRGYELYTCPAGYLPTDSSGRMITNGGSQPQDYICSPQ